MPPPEVRKPPQVPQDGPPRSGRPIGPSESEKAKEGPQEPVKDEDGKVVVAPVTQATSIIPHEFDEDADRVDEDRPDVTVSGGRYQVGSKIVNCDGEVLEDAPKASRK